MTDLDWRRAQQVEPKSPRSIAERRTLERRQQEQREALQARQEMRRRIDQRRVQEGRRPLHPELQEDP